MKHTLTNWNPLRELEDFQNRILGAFNPSLANRESQGGVLDTGSWLPLVDIVEDKDGYHFTVEIPDVAKEDVKVSVENKHLVISGERKFEKEESDKGKKYHRVERAYGSFQRSFLLPEDSDMARVDASFKDGLLKIHLPKSEESRPKNIEVKVN